jgi:hypothetical protein
VIYGRIGQLRATPLAKYASRAMEAGTNAKRRVERVQFETDSHSITANVTLPSGGYKSRFSDSLNRQETAFIPVTDVEIAPLGGGEVVRRDFIILSKAHIKLAFPIEEVT